MKPGSKFDSEKLRWDLLPIKEVEEVVDVLTFGAKKYTDNNWQKVENPRDRYYAATMRHLVAWRTESPKDAESGKSHLAHAICCLLFLAWFDNQKVEDGKNL